MKTGAIKLDEISEVKIMREKKKKPSMYNSEKHFKKIFVECVLCN